MFLRGDYYAVKVALGKLLQSYFEGRELGLQGMMIECGGVGVKNVWMNEDGRRHENVFIMLRNCCFICRCVQYLQTWKLRRKSFRKKFNQGDKKWMLFQQTLSIDTSPTSRLKSMNAPFSSFLAQEGNEFRSFSCHDSFACWMNTVTIANITNLINGNFILKVELWLTWTS